MKDLSLQANGIGDAGLAAAGLRSLNLLECNIGPTGATAIAESPHLAGLAYPQLGGNKLDDVSRRRLRDRFGDRVKL